MGVGGRLGRCHNSGERCQWPGLAGDDRRLKRSEWP